jgi:hypothetical protein
MTAPTIDAYGASTATRYEANVNSVRLYTTDAVELVCLVSYTTRVVGDPPTITSITGDNAHTWILRKKVVGVFGMLEFWYTVTSARMVAENIQVNYSGNFNNEVLIAFGVSGANTSNPFDSNSAVPASTTFTLITNPSVTASTNNANDLLIYCGAAYQEWTGYNAAPTGFSNVGADYMQWGSGLRAYLGVNKLTTSAPLSSVSYPWGSTIPGGSVLLDAIAGNSPPVVITNNIQVALLG